MNKKITAAILGLSTVLAAGAASADPSGGYYTRGRVLKVEPVFETVRVNRPEEQCWDERVPVRGGPYSDYRSHTPAIAGAIIGGVLGHQIGSGSGRDWATAGGALLGSSVGRDAAYASSHYPPSSGYVVERRCDRVDHFENRRELVGYRVKYEYDGRTFWTRTDEDPGKWVEVKVDVHASETPYR